MQLVAYGAQDIYLTGNPQITFFKVVYRRHTNFAMEAIEQTINGTATTSGRVTSTISRNGDLVGRLYLEILTGATRGPVSNYGHTAIDNVSFEIGGQQIDKQYGHFMEVYSELTEQNSSNIVSTVAAIRGAANATIVAATHFQRMSGCGGTTSATVPLAARYFVPLQFYFCRNPGLALPLIALQYHEVKLVISLSATWQLGGGLTDTLALWADYIYLDTDERRRFAQVSHEYLIEQVQTQSGDANASQELNFNHPVKELIWTGGYGVATAGLFVVDANVAAAAATVKLVLNGHDRFAPRHASYFTRAQVWQHHTGGSAQIADFISVYSFALKPEEHQPSGTCNFSRIDNARLVWEGANSAGCPATGNIYAINYNVLRVMSGMGGLAYSN